MQVIDPPSSTTIRKEFDSLFSPKNLTCCVIQQPRLCLFLDPVAAKQPCDYVDVAVRCWSGLFDVTAFTCLIAQGIGGTRQGAAHTRSCHFLNLQCELASREQKIHVQQTTRQSCVVYYWSRYYMSTHFPCGQLGTHVNCFCRIYLVDSIELLVPVQHTCHFGFQEA